MKTVLFTVGLLMMLTPQYQLLAQENLTSCAAIGNAEERLACYDRAAEATRDLPVVRLPRTARTEPRSTSEEPAAPATTRQDEFGLELKQERISNAGPDSRTYTVLAASHNDFTGWTIEFDGGGIWKQVGTDDYNIEVGERYTVSRATFNSFLLSNGTNNRKIRITRVE